MDNIDRSKLFEKYLNPEGKGAYCVFKLKGDTEKPVILSKREKELVEGRLVSHIQDIEKASPQKLKEMELKIYLSYSPVASNDYSVKGLLKLCKSLEIVCANAYRLHRVTDPDYTDETQEQHRTWYIDNTNGVKDLMDTGITVRGFIWDDWLELQQLINDCPDAKGEPISYNESQYKELRAVQDANMKKDLEAMPDLMYNPETDEFDYKPTKTEKK